MILLVLRQIVRRMKSLRAGIIKAGFLISVLFWSSVQMNAQYKVSGEIIDVDFAFQDVAVTLLCDGVKSKIVVSGDGKFDTFLKWNQVSLLSFKKPGYVAKVIEFSTIVPGDVYPQTIEPYYLPVRLFKVFPGVDTVFFKNPVAKIRFDNNLKDFADDRDYSLNVKYKVEGMREKGRKERDHQLGSNKKNRKTTTKKVETRKKKEESVSEETKEVVQKDSELIKGLPPLQHSYPQGRTDESFELKGRTIDRTIFCEGKKRRIYFRVKHDWGGEFFFIDEAQLGYRCVSKQVYLESLDRLMSLK